MSQAHLLRWVDFCSWYQNAMTQWAEFWVSQARAHFPDTRIYLVTGGRGTPMLGADFAAQAKMVQKYAAGLRITNQNDDYRQSFILTRLAAAACRNYKTYFTTEESGVNRPHGVTMRIFDAATSGANGAYFKGIVATPSELCGRRNLPAGKSTNGAKNLLENLKYIRTEHPIIDVAVLFPNTTIAIMPFVLNALYYQGGLFRLLIDFDLVDENMIGDNMLTHYRFLVLLEGGRIRKKTLKKIHNWIRAGGILISGSHLFLTSIENKTDNTDALFGKIGICEKVGQGYAFCLNERKDTYLKNVSKVIYNQNHKYPWDGIPLIPDFMCKQYVTRFSSELMSYDAKKARIQLHNI